MDTLSLRNEEEQSCQKKINIRLENRSDYSFPCRLWEAGEKCLTLSQFEWNNKTRILLYGQCDYPYGQPLAKPELTEGNPIRLYSMEEITGILSSVGMSVTESCADFNDYSAPPAHSGRSSAQPDRSSAHLIQSAVQSMLAADQHTC